MSLFCFLWTPLFYLFWGSLSREGNAGAGGVWALLLGSAAALIQFFLGSLINPGGFGFSRWLSACIDIVGLPAALPFAAAALFLILRLLSGLDDLANFALLWLIPGGILRAVSWSSQNDPALLVLVPVLWTAVAVGISFFIRIIQNSFGYVIILPIIGIAALPFSAATVYWAFFSQQFPLGAALLCVTLIPMLISAGTSFARNVL
jgi:hypothetical protein